jgi:hypothetical protein
MQYSSIYTVSGQKTPIYLGTNAQSRKQHKFNHLTRLVKIAIFFPFPSLSPIFLVKDRIQPESGEISPVSSFTLAYIIILINMHCGYCEL